jgi:excisionase family DNA binding protein
MTLTAQIIEFKDGKLVLEVPDFKQVEPKELTLPDDNRLAYRITEAAEVMGMGRTTLYKLISSGKITKTEDNRLARFEMERYLKESTNATKGKSNL